MPDYLELQLHQSFLLCKTNFFDMFYSQAAAEKMQEEVELCFEALRDTIECAQDRVMAFVEAEKVEVLQQIEDHQKQLDKHSLAISRIMDQIDEYRDNDSYFNFCLVLRRIVAFREKNNLQGAALMTVLCLFYSPCRHFLQRSLSYTYLMFSSMIER